MDYLTHFETMQSYYTKDADSGTNDDVRLTMKTSELTTVGPQHVDHSPRRADNDLRSSFQLSNLQPDKRQNPLNVWMKM